jgi:hypothetical protein
MYIAFVQKSDSVMRHHHLANPMGAKLVCVALVEVDPHLRGGRAYHLTQIPFARTYVTSRDLVRGLQQASRLSNGCTRAAILTRLTKPAATG